MSWWSNHGTKIIGAATTAVGVLGAVDPNVLGAALGPKGTAYAAALAGILTIIRGVQNTNAQNPPPPLR
jgi:hypothetical protein